MDASELAPPPSEAAPRRKRPADDDAQLVPDWSHPRAAADSVQVSPAKRRRYDTDALLSRAEELQKAYEAVMRDNARLRQEKRQLVAENTDLRDENAALRRRCGSQGARLPSEAGDSDMEDFETPTGGQSDRDDESVGVPATDDLPAITTYFDGCSEPQQYRDAAFSYLDDHLNLPFRARVGSSGVAGRAVALDVDCTGVFLTVKQDSGAEIVTPIREIKPRDEYNARVLANYAGAGW